MASAWSLRSRGFEFARLLWGNREAGARGGSRSHRAAKARRAVARPLRDDSATTGFRRAAQSGMDGCCDPRGCDSMFGAGYARERARRYRRRGLGVTERNIVDFLGRRGLHGTTILEIGGGIGEIQLQLLLGGAARATNLELVDAYDSLALALADQAHVSDRIERRVLDIAAKPDLVESADIVVMHRVVCCYPDYERLLGAAADHARRLLVFSHPPRNVASRALVAVQNATFRRSGNTFQTFAHPPEEMLAVLERRGMRQVHSHAGLVWHVVGLQRISKPLQPA